MSREYDLCEDRDDNGELPNHVYVPSLQLSRKRPRDTHHRYENGAGNNTATGSAKFVVDLELAEEVMEVSPDKKRRGVSVRRDAAEKCAQIPQGVHATEKGIGSKDAQVADHHESHEGIAAASSYPKNLESEQTSRNSEGSANNHSKKQSTLKSPSNVSGWEHGSMLAAAVTGRTEQVINEEDLTAKTSLGRESPISIDDPTSPAWENRLSELAYYRKIHGHCNVPHNYSENPKLANWVKKQRRKYRLHLEGKTSPMTPLRIQKLESLGFEWIRSCFLTAWEGRLSELADYRKIHGHCNVPQRYSENTKLGKWVKTQRYQYKLHLKGKRSSLTLSRIQALGSLGFEWKSSISRGKGKPKKPSLDDDATRVRESTVDAPGHVQTTAHTQEDLSAREIRSNQNDVAFEPEEHDWNGEVYLGYIPCRTEEI
jgi:hypothetical protein